MSRLEIPGYLTLTVIVLVSGFGRWFGSAAAVPAVVAAVGLWIALVRTGSVGLRRPEGLGRFWVPLVVAGGLLAAIYLVFAQWGNLWCDTWCHHSLVNGFVRSGLPLPEPGAPTRPSAYHFGFDLLAAGLRHLPFVSNTESALDLTTFWAGLCVAWAAVALWRRWEVTPLQMALGLLLLFLSPGLVRWAIAGLSSLPYDTISFNRLSVTEGGTFHSLLGMLGRRGHILGILSLVLAAGSSRDLLSARAAGLVSGRRLVGFGLRFGICLGSAALSADYAVPLVGLLLLTTLILGGGGLRPALALGALAALPLLFALASGGYTAAVLARLGAEGAGAEGWLRDGLSLPSFLDETNRASWTEPVFWEALALEFGPLLFVPALLCLRAVSPDRRYGVGAGGLVLVAWAITLLLRPPGHHTDFDIHRFAAAAQHWSLLHTPILAAALGRHPRIGPRLASVVLVLVVFLYLPGRLLPFDASWGKLLRAEFVLVVFLPWAWLARERRRPPRAWQLVAAVAALLLPVFFASWHTGQRESGSRLEPPVLFEELVPEFADVSFRQAVLARPRFARTLLLQGYAVAEDWGMGSDAAAPATAPTAHPRLLPVEGTGFALLETSDLSLALEEWPRHGFRVRGLRPVLGLNLLHSFQYYVWPRPADLWPTLVWACRVEAIQP